MAQFESALKRTLGFEGGYSNNPNDTGGETIFGISRKAWPNWIGWERVDLAKAAGVTPSASDTQLNDILRDFYFTNFWCPIHGNEIQSQDIANYLFDFAVNSGVRNAAKCLQRAIGFAEEDVDGIIGPHTLAVVNPNKTTKIDWSQEILQSFKDERILFLADAIGDGRIHYSLTGGLIRRALA